MAEPMSMPTDLVMADKQGGYNGSPMKVQGNFGQPCAIPDAASKGSYEVDSEIEHAMHGIKVTEDKAKMMNKMLAAGRSKDEVAAFADMKPTAFMAWLAHQNRVKAKESEMEFAQALAKEKGEAIKVAFEADASLSPKVAIDGNDDPEADEPQACYEYEKTCSTFGGPAEQAEQAALFQANQMKLNFGMGWNPMFAPPDPTMMGHMPPGMPMPMPWGVGYPYGFENGLEGYPYGHPMGGEIKSPNEFAESGKSKSKGQKRNATNKLPPSEKPELEWTTVMMRNLPNDWKVEDLLATLDARGFKNKYDFVYLPKDFQRAGPSAGLGYAFVNLVSHEDAIAVKDEYEGFRDWKIDSKKAMECAWGQPLQGLSEHVKRYRDSPLMHPDVPKEYKPKLFDSKGNEMEWPKPTKQLRKPRMKSGGKIGNDGGVALPCS